MQRARPVNGFSLARNGAVVGTTHTKPLLREGACEHYWQVASSADKNMVIWQLEQVLSGDDEAHCFLQQRAVLVADEMLENALFAAPRDASGRPLYVKGEQRSLLPGESILLCACYDGETLALEVTDTWGSLSPETVRTFIAMNLADNNPAEDRSGRGLYFMWHFLQDFYLRVVPGAETTIGGMLQLHPTNTPQGAHYHGTILQH